jgi:hypothetical protein
LTLKRQNGKATKPNAYKPTRPSKIKTELGDHKYFIGIKTTQTEGIYRGTLQTSGGQFAVIDRGATVAALRVEAAPALQISAQVSASIGRNGLANIVRDLGLSL